jgi:probable rRNA maturation factor
VSSPASTVVLSVRGHARVTPDEKRFLLRQLTRALAAAGARGEVSLSLTGDTEIRALNRGYAREDHATDVLSFEQKAPLLGDIIISVPTARRQARAGRRSLAAELVHLAVHGLAHLLGFDHATPDEERVMFGYEARLREAARATGPVRRIPRPRPR